MLIKNFDAFSWDCPFIIKVINTTPKLFIESEIRDFASLSQKTKVTY